jgi:seryl-tRNA synthetase
MIETQLLVHEITEAAKILKKKGYSLDTKTITNLLTEKKIVQQKLQKLQEERNTRSKEVGILKSKNKPCDQPLKDLAEISIKQKETQKTFQTLESNLQNVLLSIPNIPNQEVPEGKSEEDNQVVKTWGKLPNLAFPPLDHLELGERLEQMSFEQGAKIARSRFVVLQHSLAKLQRALIQFMIDHHSNNNGYKEVYVPYLVNEDSLYSTGQLPKLREELFFIGDNWNLALTPTAEVPVTNLVRDTILLEKELPLKFVCHSPCFRSEAGSYGKDTRGMIRVHQFEKVELVHIVHPMQSRQALEELCSHAESILELLDLPYQRVALCTADLGFTANQTFDLEVWLPAQKCYREISSCSNTDAFQARRLKARFKSTETGKNQFVHTLNGSALAVGRTLVAILENYQQQDGSISIPKILQPYMSNQTSISTNI